MTSELIQLERLSQLAVLSAVFLLSALQCYFVRLYDGASCFGVISPLRRS